MPEPPEPSIYQLRVVLLGISPIIWRRLLVRGDSTIADLHHTLQITFGWSDDHLHLSIAKSPNLQKTLDFPAGSQYSRRVMSGLIACISAFFSAFSRHR